MTEKEARQFLSELKGTGARNAARSLEMNRIIKSRDFLESLKLEEIADSVRDGGSGELTCAVSSLKTVIARYGGMLACLSHGIESATADEKRAEEVLSKLSPVHERILRLRYLMQKSWVAVSLEINYSERQTYYLHRTALKEFALKWNSISENAVVR